MICKYSAYDEEIMRFRCKVTGDECLYFIPSEKTCRKEGYLDLDEESEVEQEDVLREM